MSGFPLEIVVLFLALLWFRRKPWQRIVIVIIAFSLFRLTGEIIKQGLAVPRLCWNQALTNSLVCPETFSFPSGHAIGAAMAAVILGLIFRSPTAWILGTIILVLVDVSRVASGFHTLTDVIFGSLLGIIFGWLVYRFYWK